MSADRRKWPLWVRVGLWGVPDRVSAWTYLGISLAVAAVCIAYGFVGRRFFLGGIMLVAAFHYYLCIRWVDRHGGWDDHDEDQDGDTLAIPRTPSNVRGIRKSRE
jgi:hypothetical protein